MTKQRTPKQISGDMVLCEDGTIWKWITGGLYKSGWFKLPPIPSNEQYEIIVSERRKNEEEVTNRLSNSLSRITGK